MTELSAEFVDASCLKVLDAALARDLLSTSPTATLDAYVDTVRGWRRQLAAGRSTRAADRIVGSRINQRTELTSRIGINTRAHRVRAAIDDLLGGRFAGLSAPAAMQNGLGSVQELAV